MKLAMVARTELLKREVVLFPRDMKSRMRVAWAVLRGTAGGVIRFHSEELKEDWLKKGEAE